MRTFAGEYDGPGSPDEETLLGATGHPQTDEGQDVRPCQDQDGQVRQVDQGGNSIGFFDRLKLGDPAQSIVSGPPNSLMLGMTWAIAQLWAV